LHYNEADTFAQNLSGERINMKARQVIIVMVIGLLIITIGLFASSGGNKSTVSEQKEGEEKLLKVKAREFLNTTKPLTVRGFGQVNSNAMINVSSEVQGVISSGIPLKKGTSFSKGQTLVVIRNEDVKLLLQARKSNFLNLITSILPDIKLDFPGSFTKWQQFYTSFDIEKPIPILPSVNDFKEKNFISSRNIFTEYYSIKGEEERLKKYVITAPFNGSIINAMTDDGAVVNPGSPIISILRDGNLEIEIPISKLEVNQVKKGASVSLYDDNAITAQGKVVRIGNYINPQTQSIPVFIEIIESSAPLYNGVYLNAAIAAEGFESVMELPRKALINKNRVFTVVNNELKERVVDIVFYQKNTVLVKGLEDKSMVVVEPVINGKEGAKVELIKIAND
jgi:membrane fusion protein, multidrug efflux system